MNKCNICGEDMPENEQMFLYHGYSGPCPKSPLLEPHQQRVVTEKKELDNKISRLEPFLSSETFHKLKDDEQDRLARQLGIMAEYSAILGERITAFTK